MIQQIIKLYAKVVTLLLLLAPTLISCSQSTANKNIKNLKVENNMTVQKTEEEWKQQLSPDQYYVLRQKGTEPAFTGKLLLNKEKGVYKCGACGNELFTDDMKFDSECGWPSFDKEI